LQNLGNLVEFGYKEVFMKDMNPFILQRMDAMKKFIDRISLMDPSVEPVRLLFLFLFVFFFFFFKPWIFNGTIESKGFNQRVP